MDDKNQFYQGLSKQLNALLQDETQPVTIYANASALLYQLLPDVSWVGFYLHDTEKKELYLGPFQGKPACMHIPLGKGVCGTAASTLTVQRVADVHQFPGHIACDSASNSEIVLPLIKKEQLIAVLDIDSTVFDRFSKEDEEGLIKICKDLVTLL